MKVAFIGLMMAAVVILSMFASAVFFSWAWGTFLAGNRICLEHPWAALGALLILAVSIGVAFGCPMSIPLQNLGIIKSNFH